MRNESLVIIQSLPAVAAIETEISFYRAQETTAKSMRNLLKEQWLTRQFPSVSHIVALQLAKHDNPIFLHKRKKEFEK